MTDVTLTWAVGVTTVPARRRTLLPATLASLAGAGWGGMARLFVDGCADGTSWEAEFSLPVTCRGRAVGVSGNWFLSFWELYWRCPLADRFLVVQDDVSFYQNLRQYLERTVYPAGCYQNLYTDHHNTAAIDGRRVGTWHEGVCVGDSRAWRDPQGRQQQKGRGALALCFDQAAALALLSHPHMAKKPRDPANGSRLIDGAIVESLNRAGFREVVHCPSLCQHRGHESTITVACRESPEGPVVMRQKPRVPSAATYVGDHFDALRLLPAGGGGQAAESAL